MKYNSTLWYLQNPLIAKYRDLFLKKLQYFWKRDISSDIPEQDFLLLPDIHSLLLSEAHIHDKNSYRAILLGEWESFCVNTATTSIPLSQEYIPGTSIALTKTFFNPDFQHDTHPDHRKDTEQITFWWVSQENWKILFSESFSIVKNVSPDFMSEIEQILRKIIPLWVSHSVHNSGSYGNAIGQIFMSYPENIEHPELAILEAILHEYNHNKLNLILQTEALVLGERKNLYYSPYRPDARPLHGIYLGLHAMTGAFWVIWNAHKEWILQLPENWQEKAVLYVLKNGLSLQVLEKYGSFSPLGKEILGEMRAVHHECLESIKKSRISPEVIKHSKEKLTTHYQEVKRNFPQLLV